MFSRKSIIDNIKTIFYALIIAVLIRSIFLQPFYIPSSSMEPNLLIGDRLFVTNTHMATANILFLLVQKSLMVEFFFLNLKEEML